MRPKNLQKEEAIRRIALEMIAADGLENLSMQKLAKAANISPRTIYLKYENKDDLLIKLFIEEVFGAYEKAVLVNFEETMDFARGMKKLWTNGFHYLTNNRSAFALLKYGQSSPLLFKAFQEKNIKQGDFFAPIHRFLMTNVKKGHIQNFPHDVLRALLFSPLFDLVNEFFDYSKRPRQIITEKLIVDCCTVVTKGILK